MHTESQLLLNEMKSLVREREKCQAPYSEFDFNRANQSWSQAEVEQARVCLVSQIQIIEQYLTKNSSKPPSRNVSRSKSVKNLDIHRRKNEQSQDLKRTTSQTFKQKKTREDRSTKRKTNEPCFELN